MAESPRCGVCGRPVLPTDATTHRQGLLVHVACVGARKPEAKIDGPMKNRRDAHGLPLCPVCDQRIGVTEAAARVGEYMVHIGCTPEARRRRDRASSQ